MYRFTEYAKSNPIRLRHEGEWVAIGCDIVLEREAPKFSVVVKAATQKQMEQLIKKYPKYIEYVEDAKPKKSDALERERFEGDKDSLR